MPKMLRVLSLLSIFLCLLLATPVVGQELTPEPDETVVATAVAGDPVDAGDPGVVIVEPVVPDIMTIVSVGLMMTVIGLGFLLGRSAPPWVLQLGYSAAGNVALLTPGTDDDQFFEEQMRARGYEKHTEPSGIVIYRPIDVQEPPPPEEPPQ